MPIRLRTERPPDDVRGALRALVYSPGDHRTGKATSQTSSV